jgi:hypothetical protein
MILNVRTVKTRISMAHNDPQSNLIAAKCVDVSVFSHTLWAFWARCEKSTHRPSGNTFLRNEERQKKGRKEGGILLFL